MVYSANPISKEQLQRAINAQLESAGLPTDEDALIEMIEEYGGGGGNGELFLPFAPSPFYDQYQLTPLIPMGYKLLGEDTANGKSNEQMITNAGIAGATSFDIQILWVRPDSNNDLVLGSTLSSQSFNDLNVDLSPDSLLAEAAPDNAD